MDTPGKRLRKIRHLLGLTQGKFGEKLGLRWEKIKDLEAGRNILRPELAKNIENIFGVSANWLLFGEGDIFLDGINNDLNLMFNNEIEGGNFRYVLMLNNIVNNKLNFTENHFFKFSKKFFQELSISKPDDTFLYRIKDNSLYPVLSNHDIVLISKVNSNELEIVEGKFYVFNFNNKIIIRKLFYDDDLKNFILQPENKEYKTLKITEETLQDKIIGRVVWVSKILI